MFYESLCETTADARSALLTRPVLRRVMEGSICQENYTTFLVNAWHHVRHTVPLMMSMGARLPDRSRWLLPALEDYIREEIGHEAWIENDLRACIDNTDARLAAPPHPTVELMVAYIYDYIARVNPLGFFGMVHVLEGTSTSIATAMADLVQKRLHLPDEAFSYLRSHGELDQSHVRYFADLINRIDCAEDRQSIVHVATMMYRLYGDVLQSAGDAAP